MRGYRGRCLYVVRFACVRVCDDVTVSPGRGARLQVGAGVGAAGEDHRGGAQARQGSHRGQERAQEAQAVISQV